MMKLVLMFLLMAFGANAQKQIYNVQQYCVDEAPFQSDKCDIKGNEYSFVFVDAKKDEVALYISDTKITFEIVAVKTTERGFIYTLKDQTGAVEMTINKAQDKIVFIGSTRHITLKVGKSTKMT